MMHGIEVVKDKSTKEWFEPAFGLGGKLTAALMQRGLYTRVRSEVICNAPPLITDESTLDDMVRIYREAIDEVTLS